MGNRDSQNSSDSQVSNLNPQSSDSKTEKWSGHKIISKLKDEYHERIVDKYSSLLDNYMLSYRECRKHWIENKSSIVSCQRRLLHQCDKLTAYYDHIVSKLPINVLKANGIERPPACLVLSKDMESIVLHTHILSKIHYIGSNQNNDIIQVNNNDLIIVNLNENPTTGYSWDLKTSSGLIVTETIFSPLDDSGQLIGSGGMRTWSIRVFSKGEQMIFGIYKRPWEDTTENTFGFNLKVNVN